MPLPANAPIDAPPPTLWAELLVKMLPLTVITCPEPCGLRWSLMPPPPLDPALALVCALSVKVLLLIVRSPIPSTNRAPASVLAELPWPEVPKVLPVIDITPPPKDWFTLKAPPLPAGALLSMNLLLRTWRSVGEAKSMAPPLPPEVELFSKSRFLMV